MDVEFPGDRDPVTGPGYVWHCHMLNHEDHEMMRPQPLVLAWRPEVSYPAGKIIAHNSVDYRARAAHVNGRPLRPGANYPLPPQRNHGYLVETTGGATFTAR